MSALTTRDALAKALADCWHDDWVNRPNDLTLQRLADALIASDAVVDAATLADEMRAMADVWGGDAAWLTTGTKVANLAAEWIDEALSERAQ